jgi:hypothetical protein
MQVLVYPEKSQTQNELLQLVMNGAARIRNNHERIRKVICAVLKQSRLCIASTEGNFEQRAA